VPVVVSLHVTRCGDCHGCHWESSAEGLIRSDVWNSLDSCSCVVTSQRDIYSRALCWACVLEPEVGGGEEEGVGPEVGAHPRQPVEGSKRVLLGCAP